MRAGFFPYAVVLNSYFSAVRQEALAVTKKPKHRYLYRSSVTGKVVTKSYAKLNPDTTVRERLDGKPRKRKPSARRAR